MVLYTPAELAPLIPFGLFLREELREGLEETVLEADADAPGERTVGAEGGYGGSATPLKMVPAGALATTSTVPPPRAGVTRYRRARVVAYSRHT